LRCADRDVGFTSCALLLLSVAKVLLHCGVTCHHRLHHRALALHYPHGLRWGVPLRVDVQPNNPVPALRTLLAKLTTLPSGERGGRLAGGTLRQP